MALLALVAAAGRRGISRDRVLGLLWPDATEEQARHTLSQALYTLKRDTGRECIVAAPELRLDPDIESDIGELERALDAGNHEAAAGLYTGIFLDGFFLPGAAEFDRWVEDERTRLRMVVSRAAERGVADAEARGDRALALRFWTHLTALDPLSARYAAGRMRVLLALGDRAGALAHAREHEAVVRRDLETEVDPAIRDFVAELRTDGRMGGQANRADGRMGGEADGREGGFADGQVGGQADGRMGGRRRVGVVIVAVVALLVAGVALLRSTRTAQPIPFLAVGTVGTPEQGDTGTAGAVLRDMLATGLGGLGGIQVVANSRLVELTPPANANERSATVDAARRAGATEILEGEVTREDPGLVLTLRRVDLTSGVVRKGYRVRAAERYALVDSAVAEVARDFGLTAPSLTVREVRTSSPEAYLLYNEGLRAFYGFDAPGAARLMNAALERDSTFAMAAFYAWLIGENLGDAEGNARRFEQVKRLAPHALERERLRIQAEAARREAPLPVAIAIAETLTVRYPGDPDGHILLGQVQTEQGDYAGAIASFERAIAIDSIAGSTRGPYCRICQAMGVMTHAYLWWDSAAAAERTGRRMMVHRPDDRDQWNILVEPLLRQGRRSEAEAATERSGVLGQAYDIVNDALHRDLLRWSRLEELDRELRPGLRSPALVVRSDARWLLLLSLRDQGRLRDARALALEARIPGSTDRIAGLQPERAVSATLLSGLGRPDSAARLLHAEAQRFLSEQGITPGTRARGASWHFALAGTAYHEAGDTATVRRLADSIEVLGPRSTFGRDVLLPHYLRGILHQRAGRHGEAVQELRRAVWSITDGYTVINLALARSLTALGQPTEAVAVLRPAIRGGLDGSNTYTSRTELHEAMAEAFERAGQRDSAVAHYRVVERSWRHADPEFRARYERARSFALR